jgi:hypothetical protein
MTQFRACCYFVVETARLASIDPKYNLMFEWGKLNEAQKEEKKEEVGGYKEEIDGFVSAKLDLEQRTSRSAQSPSVKDLYSVW